MDPTCYCWILNSDVKYDRIYIIRKGRPIQNLPTSCTIQQPPFPNQQIFPRTFTIAFATNPTNSFRAFPVNWMKQLCSRGLQLWYFTASRPRTPFCVFLRVFHFMVDSIEDILKEECLDLSVERKFVSNKVNVFSGRVRLAAYQLVAIERNAFWYSSSSNSKVKVLINDLWFNFKLSLGFQLLLNWICARYEILSALWWCH